MMDTKWTQPSFVKHHGPGHDLGVRGFGTEFHAVTSEVDVWVYTGKTRKSNAWIGSSNVLAQELRRITLKPGDEVHVTCGDALWIVTEGSSEALRVCSRPDDDWKGTTLRPHTRALGVPEWKYREGGRNVKYAYR